MKKRNNQNVSRFKSTLVQSFLLACNLLSLVYQLKCNGKLYQALRRKVERNNKQKHKMAVIRGASEDNENKSSSSIPHLYFMRVFFTSIEERFSTSKVIFLYFLSFKCVADIYGPSIYIVDFCFLYSVGGSVSYLIYETLCTYIEMIFLRLVTIQEVCICSFLAR